MTPTFRSLAYLIPLALAGACATGSSSANYPGSGMVKTAPSPSTPRLFDCMGENQGTDGTTRPDCLPNKGDEAERDTEAGAGDEDIRP